MAHLHALQARLDTTQALVRRAMTLLPPAGPNRAGAAILVGKKVEDEEQTRSRMTARIIEILSAAGIGCEIRYWGATLQ